jgi:signal transduction histidine kinase
MKCLKGAGPRRRGIGLRSLLTALVFGAIILPSTLGSLVVSLLSSGIDEHPSIRFSAVRRELGKAVAPDGKGGLRARPDYKAPEWLILIVTDRNDRIVYSDVKSLAAGEDIDKILSLLGQSRFGAPSSLKVKDKEPTCVYVETVELGGEVLGSYYALVWPVDLRSLSRSSNPYTFLFVLACFALAATLGAAGVSAMLARSVMKLEKAAILIASGDLETRVQLGGIREIASLAGTMDTMRTTLREDRDRRARFLAAVSHDLRTPLTSIGGYLEAVEDGLASDPGTLSRYVSIMQDKTAVLEERIQGLIEFARMETGEWRLGFRPLAMGPFLERLAREFGEEAELRGFGFRSELSAIGGLHLPADEALLCRAFENLVSNAFKHSPPGGAVSLSARRTDGASPPGFSIDIDDEGSGIPSAERELVFEPFYRGKGAAAQGNGLGLYIARSVIRSHGWDIEVGDAPSGGARFTVRIPGGTNGKNA